MKNNIILASASPRRKALLRKMGLKFKVCPAHINEEIGSVFNREKLKKLALDKALALKSRFRNHIIIGADTIVIMKNRIFGKPGSKAGAVKMLQTLSGTTQQVWTGIAVIDTATQKKLVKAAVSRVKMKKLEPEVILNMAVKNRDKSGAYAIQEDDKYVSVVSGSVTNIVGLPTELLKEMLKKFGITTKLVRK